MRDIRHFLAALVVCALSITFVFAQEAVEEEGEWFWNEKIAAIDFEGLKTVRKSELTGITSGFIGVTFSEDTYTDILDRLYALDLFVDIVPYVKHASVKNNDILLVFQVEESPVIDTITFAGNKQIRNGELREQIKLKASEVYVESKVLVAERTIRDYYLSKGYTNSRVSHSTEETAKGLKVTFNISEGMNTVITEIRFSGNTIASERTLKRKLELKEVGFLRDGAFQNSSLEKDKQTIIQYYADRGYIDADVIDAKIDSVLNEEKSRKELIITFVVQEGSQYTFGGLTVKGNEVFSSEKLLDCMKLHAGSIFNLTKFQEGISALTGIYYENGYMTNEFYPVPVKDTERQIVSYDLTIVEHARSHIENVIIKGNTKTKDYVIRREIPIEPGDIFSKEKIISGMRNLYNLQYFANVVPEPMAGSEQNLVDLVWNVEDQSTTSLNLGINFAGVADPDTMPISIQGRIQNSNLFGEGRSVSLGANYSTSEQSIDLTYSQNWIGNLPISLQESLSFSHSKTYTLLDTWLPDMSFQQRYYYMMYEGYNATLGSSVGKRWYTDYAILSLALGLNNSINSYVYDENLYVPVDTGLSLYANRLGVVNSVFSSFSFDHRDLSYDPSKGWFASQRVAWFGLLPEPIEKEFFLKTDTKLEGYLKLVDVPVTENWNFKLVLAAYSGLTNIFPVEGTVVSDSNRLYVDGMFNGRGWTEAYKMAYGKGLSLWSNKLELRMPLIPNIIGLGGFWDAAVVKPTVKDMFTNLSLSDFYFSFGPSIRFLIPNFPINFIFAWRYRYEDGSFKWAASPFNFTLSFNLINR